MIGLTHDITFGSELHKKIANAVRDRINASKQGREKFIKRWNDAEERAVAYLPERDADIERRLAREDGKPQYTTIQIPYSYALLMAAHTYFTSVFLSRTPIFQFAGRHGEAEMNIQAMEAHIDYQINVGRNLTALFIWLFDAPKYGHGIVGTHWERKEHRVSEMTEVADEINGIELEGTRRKVKQSRIIKGYEGNKISNIRPLDFFPDPRYPLHEFQRGEFCAVLNPAVSINRLKEAAAKGTYTNIDKIKRKGHHSAEREQGSTVADLPDNMDFGKSQTLDKLAADSVELYECYIELVPQEWGLGRSNMPEKWVFTVTSDFETVIGAQPHGAWHNEFPFDVLEFEPEGYSIFNRSLMEITQPFQEVIDWLINSHFYNVRKTLNNQWIVDPSRVVMKDVENPLPGGIIRMKPRAYGQDAKNVIEQLQAQDLTRTHMNDLGSMLQLGERLFGINDMMQGANTPQSRRSAAEIRTTTNFAVSRLKTISELMSSMGFTPLAQKLVQNSQQYYDSDLKLRIVGDTAQFASESFVNVTPEMIAGFYDYEPVDGTLPVDRFAQASLWANMLGQVKQMPEIMQQYDMGKIFAWVAQLAGIKNIHQFKIQTQVVPDDQLQEQERQGNVVPVRQKGNPLTPDQIPGTGQAG